MLRAQREVPSSKRAQQAAALQELAELRARKGGTRQPLPSGNENRSAAANMQTAAGCAASACLEDSDSGEEVREQHALASPRSSAQQPLRRLRRLAASGSAAAKAEAACPAAAVGELADSLAGLSVASAAGCRPDIATPHSAVPGECSETPVSVSSSQHSHSGDAGLGTARSAGLGADTSLPLGSVVSACGEVAAGSANSSQLSSAAGARQQSSPGDLVLGERSEYVLPSCVASKLYSHQVTQADIVLHLFGWSVSVLLF